MGRLNVAVLGAVLAACAARTPLVPEGPHIDKIASIEHLEYPPPPAQEEVVPPQPSSDCLWMDGHWEWGRRWRWIPGEWVVPPSGCYYAPAKYRFLPDGSLEAKKAAWYPAGPSLATVEALKASCKEPRSCNSGGEPYRPPHKME